jgi:hypothetical protein
MSTTVVAKGTMSGPAPSGTPGAASDGVNNTDSIVLEEEIDPNYVPTESEGDSE